MLTALGHGLHLLDGDPLRFVGIPFTTRACLVELAEGGLWIHSPVALTPARVQAVRDLGELRHIVAPNHVHHLYVGPWAEAFPEATLWADRDLPRKRPDLRFDHVLGDEAEPAWAQSLDQLRFEGSFFLAETVFLHRASRTLIFTDLLQNHDPAADGWFWRSVKRAAGVLAPGGAPNDWRLTVNDRAAARRARDRVLAWDFERVVFAHGDIVEQGARAWVEGAFAWLGEG